MNEKDFDAVVAENLILAELGEPLTFSLAILNTHAEFRKKWMLLQTQWHGTTMDKRLYAQTPKAKEMQRLSSLRWRNKPEVKERLRLERQTPEFKAKRISYIKAYRKRKKLEQAQ